MCCPIKRVEVELVVGEHHILQDGKANIAEVNSGARRCELIVKEIQKLQFFCEPTSSDQPRICIFVEWNVAREAVLGKVHVDGPICRLENSIPVQRSSDTI